ncbi:hypothetical protein [Reinekea blandensis]|uniref:Uncharacterized protein n=1 Tax=Reinekea blandensis MED297 TaxID=314283 RepID=A4BHY7_9GAMM|nr:hypothetical protein [Reinekea blandensis]EAR08259.1 hypothetical protein MED297_13952 [Reinekea sp. MED297] [Reinekea blandensis MED297]
MKPDFTLIFAFTLALFTVGCANDDDANGNNGENADSVLRQIAGNAAIGRPARWSNNCLDVACARADDLGNYLLTTEADGSSLMWSDVPIGPGEPQRLYSRYRWNDAITTSLVNINPSTHAVLDIWSNVSQGVSIDACAASASCQTALMASLTETQENAIIDQLDTLMGEAWPAGRNPFDDVYVADPNEDALDQMHDHFLFHVDGAAGRFQVYDNEGEEPIIDVNLVSLTNGANLTDSVLSDTQFETALSMEPPAEPGNPIQLQINVSPGQPTQVPYQVIVDTIGSTSPNTPLSFSHELTLPDGTTQSLTGEEVITDLTQGGRHVWVVTATDDAGNQISDGVVLEALAGEVEPTFGGEGSCVTPEATMTANSWNLCEEPQNGGEYQCDTLSSSSITLTQSPAPCPQQTQNGGDLLGLCTILVNEVRVLFYENPLRPNNTETFADKQARVADYCVANFGGDWSTTP